MSGILECGSEAFTGRAFDGLRIVRHQRDLPLVPIGIWWQFLDGVRDAAGFLVRASHDVPFKVSMMEIAVSLSGTQQVSSSLPPITPMSYLRPWTLESL